MSFFKGIADKLQQKKEELEEEARRRAAKKATDMAIASGKAAARSAVRNAERGLDFAGKQIERVLFGEAIDDEDGAVDDGNGRSGHEAGRDREREERAPDPFAKLRAREAEATAAREARDTESRAAAAREEAARRERSAEREREVDDELAALKRRLGKKP